MSLSRASLLAAAVAASLVVTSTQPARAESPAPEPHAAASSSSSSGSGLRTVGVVNVVIGGTLILGGALIALSGVSLKKRVDDECPGKVCPLSAAGDLDSLRGRATAANVFWIAGAVTAVSGIALIIASGTGERDASGEQRGAIVIVPSAGGLSASIRF